MAAKMITGISIAPEVFRKYPGFQVGFIFARDINNSTNLQKAMHLLKEAEKMIRLTFNDETLRNHYLISPWKAAQEEFKGKAEHYHTIVEKLLKQVLAGHPAEPQDTVTALAYYLSLKHLLPIAVDDAAKLHGEVVFSVARAKKERIKAEKIKAEGLYYHDRKNTLGTHLDYWQNSKVLPTKHSTSVLIHISALPPVTRNKVREVMLEIERLLHAFCGGKVQSARLHWRKTKVVWK